MSKKQDKGALIEEIKQLFESKAHKHKQDRDFLKSFQAIAKKDKFQQKSVVDEVLSQIKTIGQSKSLYFNTIVDALFIILLKQIPIDDVLQDIFNSPCQTDKKAKEQQQDYEDLKLFCFQKLEANAFQDYQMNKKVIVFMERAIKNIQLAKPEERKTLMSFLHQNKVVNLQAQIQTMTCILIQKMIIAMNRQVCDLEIELKIYGQIEEFATAIKTVIVIAQTSMQHAQYAFIFKACAILMTHLIHRTLNVGLFTGLAQQFYPIVQTIIRDYGFNLTQEKEQSKLLDQPRIAIDLLSSDLILELIIQNPHNWMTIQSFIQRQPISDLFLTHTINSLACRTNKMIKLLSLLKLDKKVEAIKWIVANAPMIEQSLHYEEGNYNAYIYSQIHLLLHLDTFGCLEFYFRTSNIKQDSKLFKVLCLLRLEHHIFKYQNQIQLFRVTQNKNTYYPYFILQQLKLMLKQRNYKQVYHYLSYQNDELHQSIFIKPAYITALMKDLCSKKDLNANDQELYLGIIVQLLNTRQCINAFFIQLFNEALNNSTKQATNDNLIDIQERLLQDLGIQFNAISLDDNPMFEMFKVITHYFTTGNMRTVKFPKLQRTYSPQSKIYLFQALDRFLMLNGLQQCSSFNLKSTFAKFYDNHLSNNQTFLDILLLIVTSLKHERPSQYLYQLAIYLLMDLNRSHSTIKFKIIAHILDHNNAKKIIESVEQFRNPHQFYSCLMQHNTLKTYRTRKLLLQSLLNESKLTKGNFNILLKLLNV